MAGGRSCAAAVENVGESVAPVPNVDRESM